jgi:serine/threonine protein kinase
VHRDVTPANILLTDTGRAKLADFGIAKAAEADSVTTVGQVVGTPAYIAPERLRGEEATPASDIYGLGATLNAAVGMRTADLDRNFAALVDRMMDPDPVRRPSADAALAAFDGTDELEPDTTVVAAVAPAQATVVADVVAPRRPLSWRDNGVRLATVGIAAVIGLVLLLASNGGGNGTIDTSDETPPTTVTAPVPTTFAEPPPSVNVGVNVDSDDESDEPRGKGKAKGRKDDDD